MGKQTSLHGVPFDEKWFQGNSPETQKREACIFVMFGEKIHSEVTLDLNCKDVQILTHGGSARSFQVGSTR